MNSWWRERGCQSDQRGSDKDGLEEISAYPLPDKHRRDQPHNADSDVSQEEKANKEEG